METLLDSPPRTEAAERPLTPIVPHAESVGLAELFIDEINSTLPLFQRVPVVAKFRLGYPCDRRAGSPAWWASVHAILALATRHKAAFTGEAASGSRASMLPWTLWTKAFSAYADITKATPDLLSAQALLAMAYFLGGSSDATTTALLTTSAVRTIQFLEPSRGPQAGGSGSFELLFWVAFVLDVDASINAGLPLAHVEGWEDSGPRLPEPGGPKGLDAFLMQVELYRIRARIYHHLSRDRLQNGTSRLLVSEWAEFEMVLKAWEQKYPIHLSGPDSLEGPLRRHAILLRLALYDSMAMFHDTMVRAVVDTATANTSTLGSLCDGFAQSRADAAKASIDLVQHMESLSLTDLGHALPILLASSITLLAVILRNLGDIQVPTNISRLETLRKFIEKLQAEKGHDLERFLMGCKTVEDFAKAAVAQASGLGLPDDLPQPLFEVVSKRDSLAAVSMKLRTVSHTRLSRGLVGNSPKLVKNASDFFSDIFPHWRHDDGPWGWLTPASLRPDKWE